MKPSSKRLRVVVALVASTVLIAGGVNVAARDGSDPSDPKNGGATRNTAKGGKGSTSKAGKSGSKKAITPPVGAKAAASGVYRYTVKKSGQKDVGITEMRIEPAVPSSTGMRQRFVSGDATSYVAFIEEWRSDGLYLLKREVKTKAGRTDDCSFSAPANVIFGFPLQVGKSWPTTAPSCGYPPTTAQVIGRERVSIGGVGVDTYVVRSITRGAFTETRTLWYSPGWHLIVKRVVRSDGTNPRTKRPSTFSQTDTLVSLTPA